MDSHWRSPCMICHEYEFVERLCFSFLRILSMYARLRTPEALLHKKDVEKFIISLQVELYECLNELCTDGESFAKSPYCSPHSLQCVDFDGPHNHTESHTIIQRGRQTTTHTSSEQTFIQPKKQTNNQATMEPSNLAAKQPKNQTTKKQSSREKNKQPSTHEPRQPRSQTAKQIALAATTFVRDATHADEAKKCIHIAR